MKQKDIRRKKIKNGKRFKIKFIKNKHKNIIIKNAFYKIKIKIGETNSLEDVSRRMK